MALGPVGLRPPSPSCRGDGERPHGEHQPFTGHLFSVVTLFSASRDAGHTSGTGGSQSFDAVWRQGLLADVDSTCVLRPTASLGE